MRTSWFPVVLALLAGGPAWSADRPKLVPTRDVEVEYRTTGTPRGPMGAPMGGPTGGSTSGADANGRGTLTIHFTSNGNRIRVEGMNGRGYAIVDRAAGRVIIVMTERRMYMELPHDMSNDPNGLAAMEAATFNKIGTETIAGIGCTLYETTVKERKGKLCLADDGVWLHSVSGDPANPRELEAVKVTYATQPTSLFEPPAGFQKFDMPAGMPPGVGGPGGPMR
jgi:Domain of unknown function (DUF4412)